jgi:hypothetical protein
VARPRDLVGIEFLTHVTHDPTRAERLNAGVDRLRDLTHLRALERVSGQDSRLRKLLLEVFGDRE